MLKRHIFFKYLPIYTFSICIIIASQFTYGQNNLIFKVYSGDYDRIDCPIKFELPNNIDLSGKKIHLVETGNAAIAIPAQLDNNTNELVFILKGNTPKNTNRAFQLVQSKLKKSSSIQLKSKNGGLLLLEGRNPILNYQFEMTYPPKGVDENYKKSGFIHPIWSPSGQVLSRIQPPDHYHHYGIWGPWTKTHIEGREVDFWNLNKDLGTVLFKEFKDKTEGEVYSGFTAIQEHIDFKTKEENRIAIVEELNIKSWNIDNSKSLVDYNSTFSTPLTLGILFDAYRYGGGIGYRATEKWNENNSTILTSEGKTRLDADGTNAKWVLVEGESNSESGRSGILFMGLPTNREFPEPIRVWPIGSNNGSDNVFFEFCPIRHKDWKIEPNTNYQLNYRMLIFDGNITAEQAEIYWQGFANPPKVTIH